MPGLPAEEWFFVSYSFVLVRSNPHQPIISPLLGLKEREMAAKCCQKWLVRCVQPGVSFYIISYFTPFSLLRRNVITTDVSVVVAGVHLSLDDGTSHWDFVGVGRSVRHRPLAQSSKIRWVWRCTN